MSEDLVLLNSQEVLTSRTPVYVTSGTDSLQTSLVSLGNRSCVIPGRLTTKTRSSSDPLWYILPTFPEPLLLVNGLSTHPVGSTKDLRDVHEDSHPGTVSTTELYLSGPVTPPRGDVSLRHPVSDPIDTSTPPTGNRRDTCSDDYPSTYISVTPVPSDILLLISTTLQPLVPFPGTPCLRIGVERKDIGRGENRCGCVDIRDPREWM